jgi:cell division septation protein DedD
MSKRLWIAGVFLVIPAVGGAQTSSDSAAYKQAQTLVNDGNATAGRAIVDSLIARSTPGSNAYAEGLYWRAVLSATAADAEMDYRRIIVDYPLSPRVEDVLLRLAQLELARADYDGALQHLNRLTLEHPGSATRARAGYWTARVLFEKKDVPRACAANADALARTSDGDTELRNQISYLNQRCVGAAIATATPTSPPAVTPAGPPAVAPTTPPPVAGLPVATANDSTVPKKPPMQIPAAPMDGKPTMIVGGVKTTTTTSSSSSKSVPAKPVSQDESSGSGEYSVQVAAYNVKSQAQAMAARLKKNGYEARVSGTAAPFRVRIGHYATQAQATAVMRSLKAKQINGFVVKAELQ